jgi:hypothetical protein
MINKIQNLRKQPSVGQTYTAADIAAYNALLLNGKVFTKLKMARKNIKFNYVMKVYNVKT